jgi:hypothetical protein
MFDVDGNLTVPSSVIFADNTAFNGNTVSLTEGENFAFNLLAFVGGNYAPTQFSIYPTYIKLPTGNGSIKVGSEENNDTWSLDSTNNALSFPNNDIIRYNGDDYGLNLYTFEKPVVITAGQTNEWTFGNTGTLTAPGDITTSGNVSGINGTFTAAVTARNINADGGNISLNPDFGLIFTQSNAVITADTASWTFGTDGNLTVPGSVIFSDPGKLSFLDPCAAPLSIGSISSVANIAFGDNTYQTTAWTGTVDYANVTSAYGNAEVATYLSNYNGSITFTASPAVISGLGSISTVNANISGNITFGDSTVQSTAWDSTVDGYAVGYKEVPQVAAGNVTLALSDSGKHYYSSAASPTTLTIPSNANVAFPIGTAISIVNSGTGNITIGKQAEANLYLAGNAVNTTRTLTSYGMATVLKTATDQWFISGSGLQ